MAVRDDWHGKGAGSALMRAATELADEWLDLSRLELEVYTDNAPAIGLYEKFGFVRGGAAPAVRFQRRRVRRRLRDGALSRHERGHTTLKLDSKPSDYRLYATLNC